MDGTPAAGDLPNGGRSAPPEDWITQSLPPGYQPPPLPRNFDKLATRRLGQGGGRRWMVALSAVLALVVAATTVFYIVRNPPRLGGSSSTPRQANCQPGTACAAANAFLTAYSGGDYEKMYTLTSAASQKRFNSPTILRGNYKDAHDYIVNRTSAILAEASVGEIDVTPGQAAQKSPTQATVPVHITMNSARVGQITQDLTLPLVKESGQWRVDWSPGLIFSKIDDPADPTYARRVHMFPQDAHRGSILDAGGDVLAQDGTASRGIELLAAGATLMIAVLTSRARLRTRRLVAAAFGPAIVIAGIVALFGHPHPELTFAAVAVLLACTVAVILHGLVRLILEQGVILQAVFGALGVYVLVGLTFAFTIGALATGMSNAYFTQGDATQSIRVYYSFTVLTTTGFGDYTAATRGGHALAVLEMLLGQLYLVTVIGLLVGNLRRRQR